MSDPNPNTPSEIQELRALLEDALMRAHQLERELDEIHIGKFWQLRMRSVALRRQMGRVTATVQFFRTHGFGAFLALVRRKAAQAARGGVAAIGARLRRRQAESVPVSFGHVDDPLVSVILCDVGDGGGGWAGCLRSLHQNMGTIPLEVILSGCGAGVSARVDGASTAESIPAAAAQARGRYLCFLSNRAQVHSGWLESLVRVIDPAGTDMLIQGYEHGARILSNTDGASPDPAKPHSDEGAPPSLPAYPHPVGIVGSQLLYSDIRLKEAGGVIWRDATRVSYGRGDMPGEPQYSYLRDVDFCSGDSLLVRRDLFLEEPPSCAWWDVDLCFLARRKGFRVVYQPKSRVTVHESEPRADDLRTDEEFTRQAEFEEKWRGDLVGHLPHDGTFVERAARRLRVSGQERTGGDAGATVGQDTSTEAGATGGTSILIVDSYVPLHDRESGSLRLYQIIRMLREMGHSVTFLPDNGSPKEPYTSELQELGVETLYTTSKQQNMARQLSDRLTLIDIAWLCRPEICAKYLPLLRRRSGLKVIYDTIDLHFLRMKRQDEMREEAGSEGVPPSSDPSPVPDMLIPGYEHGTRNVATPVPSLIPSPWRAMQSKETALGRAADATLVVSPVEKEILEGLDVRNVQVLPNIHPIYHGPARGFETRQGLLFIGGYNHLPNVDAVVWMAREIMPLLWETRADLTLTLLGSSPSPEVLALAGERVIVAGYVHDVDPAFLSNRVFVAPLRYGAGMKGKVGQSLSYGLPVVTTDIGAEGIGLTDGYDVLIANSAEEFARKVVEAYQDPALWEKLSVNGRELMRQYEPEQVARTLRKVIGFRG